MARNSSHSSHQKVASIFLSLYIRAGPLKPSLNNKYSRSDTVLDVGLGFKA